MATSPQDTYRSRYVRHNVVPSSTLCPAVRRPAATTGTVAQYRQRYDTLPIFMGRKRGTAVEG